MSRISRIFVGNFQDKCANRLKKIISTSGLVLFASHDEGLVNKISTKIIHMDKGKIVENGTHQELLNSRGLYARYWERQSGGFIETYQAAE